MTGAKRIGMILVGSGRDCEVIGVQWVMERADFRGLYVFRFLAER